MLLNPKKSSNTQIKAKIQCSLGFLHWFARCVSGQHSVHVDLRLRHHGLHQHDYLRKGEVWQREVRRQFTFWLSQHCCFSGERLRRWGDEGGWPPTPWWGRGRPPRCGTDTCLRWGPGCRVTLVMEAWWPGTSRSDDIPCGLKTWSWNGVLAFKCSKSDKMRYITST